MARLRLIEYLNDPSLLHTISEEEMIAWAAEVPYAGLVQRLLAQKLAIESSNDHLKDHANTMAIITNANPDHTIRSIEDFKQFVLRGEDKEDVAGEEQGEEEATDIKGHSISDEDDELTDDAGIVEEELIVEKEVIESEFSVDLTEEKEVPTEPTSDLRETMIAELKNEAESDIYDESEFSTWLAGLQALEESSDDGASPIKLKEKALASQPLAELLVSQGHYSRAIEMYELLILKYPQKSSFFAAQIEKVKAL